MAQSSGRTGALMTLQAAQTGSSNGVVLNTANASSVLVEIGGAPSGIICNVEGSIDGTTWQALALVQMASLTAARFVAPTVSGLFRLESSVGLVGLRCRTSGSGGTMTIRAVASYY